MQLDLEHVHEVAVRLAQEAGRYAVGQLDANNGIEAKGDGADVVTLVDREAECRIVAGIHEAFPGHAVIGEESGRHGSDAAPVHWLVDPLDGTNNYVMGMPMFGVCITVCEGDEPVAAVVHDSMRDISTSAFRGGGAYRGDSRTCIGDASPLDRTTISWSQGYAVAYDDPFRMRAMDVMERSAKRVLRTWSPSIDWGLLAAGQTGAFVLYRNELWDLVGGALTIQEAGGVVYNAPEAECVIAGHKEIVASLRALLNV